MEVCELQTKVDICDQVYNCIKMKPGHMGCAICDFGHVMISNECRLPRRDFGCSGSGFA